jgi:hypothetical protein
MQKDEHYIRHLVHMCIPSHKPVIIVIWLQKPLWERLVRKPVEGLVMQLAAALSEPVNRASVNHHPIDT